MVGTHSEQALSSDCVFGKQGGQANKSPKAYVAYGALYELQGRMVIWGGNLQGGR